MALTTNPTNHEPRGGFRSGARAGSQPPLQPDLDGGQEEEQANTPSRRALATSALASIQRFKQSWLSVMVLKSSIGLGQVITLMILLILASIIPSPSNPSHTQSTPSDQCAHPQLYQAWMGVNIFRLLTCWSASCWMLVRRERVRRAEERYDDEVEDGMRQRRNQQHQQMQHRQQQHPQRLLLEQQHQRPRRSEERQRESEWRRERQHGQAERDQVLSQTASQASSAPTLSHSMSTSSTSSLALSSSRNETPTSAYHSTFAISSSSLDQLARVIVGNKSSTQTNIIPPPNLIPLFPVDSNVGSSENHSEGLSPISPPLSSPLSCESSPVPLAAAGLSSLSLTSSTSAVARRSVLDLPRRNWRNHQHAQDMFHDADGEDAEAISSRSRLAAWLDCIAPYVSSAMGALSLTLFVLGHFLLFMPVPTSPNSCYHAAPLLWWGVMTVVGVGWALVLNIFFVVVIVYMGGAVVVTLLRKLGILDTPPEPEPPRPPQPDPLTPAELKAMSIVCYLPDPSERRPLSTISSSDHDPITLTKPTVYDPSRLPIPGIFLKSNHTTCAICQETFTPPQSASKRIMYDVEKLRPLGCGHVYHADCVDHWLLRGSGNCPCCNRPVRETISNLGEKEFSSATLSQSPMGTPGRLSTSTADLGLEMATNTRTTDNRSRRFRIPRMPRLG